MLLPRFGESEWMRLPFLSPPGIPFKLFMQYVPLNVDPIVHISENGRTGQITFLGFSLQTTQDRLRLKTEASWCQTRFGFWRDEYENGNRTGFGDVERQFAMRLALEIVLVSQSQNTLSRRLVVISLWQKLITEMALNSVSMFIRICLCLRSLCPAPFSSDRCSELSDFHSEIFNGCLLD
jgi:hypothetical protein